MSRIARIFGQNRIALFVVLLTCGMSHAALACSIASGAALGGLGTGLMGTGLLGGGGIPDCINSAANTYIPQFVNAMTGYFWSAIAVALMLFGVRSVSQAQEDMLKEGAALIFKIAIAAYIFFKAPTIYTSLVGVMYELIGWVNGNTNPWGEVDTIWIFLMGASPSDVSGVSSGGSGSAFASSFGVIGATALFTSTTGVTVAMLGVQALLSVLFLIMRVMFMLLLAQFGLAMMMILAPVIAPLLVFSSHNPQSYTKQIFERWYSIILATLVEPMFIMAFFGMVLQILNPFIIAGGAGAIMGESLQSLTNQCSSGGSSSSGGYSPCMEPNSPVASHCQVGDPQAHSSGSSGGSNNSGYGWGWAQNQINPSVATANQFCSEGGTLGVSFSRLRTQSGSSGSTGSGGGGSGSAPTVPLGMIVVVLIAIILLSYILEDFMSSMAKVARHIAGAVGLAMFEISQAPIETALKGMTNSATNAMKQSLQTSRNPVNTINAGIRGAIGGGVQSLRGGSGANE